MEMEFNLEPFWGETWILTTKQIEVRECLLLFDAESFIFQFAIQTVKDQDI